MKLFIDLRQRLGWIPAKMAKSLGVTHGHYDLLERKYKTCHVSLLVKAFEISGMTAGEFWDWVLRSVKEQKK